MSENLIPKIKDDEWFLKLIERHFEKNKRCEDDSHRQMNELALMSAIDFRLKYLNSMTSDARKGMSKKIMDVCRQNGFVPQYGSSGAPAFTGDKVKLSPDGKIIACFDIGGSITIIPTKEFFVWAKLFRHEKEKRISDISFSPDSSKIAILYWNDHLKNRSLWIWDIAELRVLISEEVDEYITEKTLSWSADSRKIAYQKKETEVCVYDFIDKKTVSLNQSAPSICLNDCGTKILLLNGCYVGRKGTIVVLDVESGEELLNEKAEISLWKPEVLFKNGQFYVLTAGVILKIEEKKVEIIEPDEAISPLNFKNHEFCGNFELKIENENRIINANTGIEKLNYIISDTLDVKQIRSFPELSMYMDTKADDLEEIDEIISNLKEKHIILNYEETRDNQTVYITDSNSIIGFELADEGETYIKWNYREYTLEDCPTFHRFQTVPSKLMESYEKISVNNLDGPFQTHNRFSLSPTNYKRKLYFRETGETVTIKDSSEIKFIAFENLERMKNAFRKKTDGEKIAYIVDAVNISEQIYHLPARGQEEKEMVILSKNSNDVDIISIPHGNRIETDDPSKEYYLDKKNNLYCVDPFSKSVVQIAENEPTSDCPLNEISYIAGFDWPKIYVTEEEANREMEDQPKQVFIQLAPMQKITIMNDINLSSVNNICIFSEKIYWLNNKQICVSEIDGSDIKRKKLIYLDNWQSLGTTHDGKISLIRIEENKKDQDRMTIQFARLYPEDGHVDVFEKAVLDKHLYQNLKHFLDVDGKDTVVVIRDWLSKIDSMKIMKEGLKSIKVVIPSIDKIDARMTPLGDDKYIISTTEYEKTNKENEKETEEEKQDIITDSDFNWRPQLRVMDSEEGSKIKYKVNQSEGQLYGLSGYAIEKSSKVFSLGNEFIVLDMKSTNSSAAPPVVLSWDISTGARYPSDANIIYGKILEKIDENSILVAEMDADCRIFSVAIYDKKMKKLSEEKPAFNWNMYYDVLNYEMINIENLKQQLQRFPDLPELPELAFDIPYYTNVITGIDPAHKIEEGDVLLFPIHICGEKRTKPVFPCISPLRDVANENNSPAWINIEAIIGTLSYGRIINPKKITLELVTFEGDNEKFRLRNCLYSVSAYNINGTYVIQQPIQEKPDDVYEQMKYRIRIIPPDDKEEIIIDGLNGWQPRVFFENISDDQIEDMICGNRIQLLREKKMLSLCVDPESFSYVVSNGEDMCFVTHIGQEKKIKQICNKRENQPVALYSDEDVSISFLPPKKIMFTFEEETKIIDDNSHELWKEALMNLYNSGQFNLISKRKNGTLQFDIGRKEVQLKGTEVEILEKPESSNNDNSICELSDGIVQNYEGVFVKRYI
jgi:hypothetical protein